METTTERRERRSPDARARLEQEWLARDLRTQRFASLCLLAMFVVLVAVAIAR